MMCSGPFRGAQGHSNLQTRTDRRGPHGLEAWRSGISTFRSSIPVLQQHAALLQYCCWNKVPFGGAGGAGGLGASGLDGPSAFRHYKKPCPPSIRKRCACGFPQGATEPLRHASNNDHVPRFALVHPVWKKASTLSKIRNAFFGDDVPGTCSVPHVFRTCIRYTSRYSFVGPGTRIGTRTGTRTGTRIGTRTHRCTGCATPRSTTR